MGTPDAFPTDHATTQNNLGNALSNLAAVRDREQNLTKAIDAYAQALKVYTLVAFPIIHAQISYNLAFALLEKARSETGTHRATSLKEAADAACQSLQVAEQERLEADATEARELLEEIAELARHA